MIASFSQEHPNIVADATLLFQRAEGHLRLRNVAEAVREYTHAERAGFDPDACAGARWICYMLLGDFASAWRESDLIQRRGKHDPNRFWSGAPLTQKRVLVRCLHGLGDTIQFIRYAPLLLHCTFQLTIETQPSLKALITASGLADHVMTWGEAEPAYDEQIEVIELPRFFGTTLETVPAQAPYLRVPAGAEQRSVRDRPRIGVVWASSQYNTARSLPVSLLAELVRRRPDLEFCSFQAEPDRQELKRHRLPVADLFDDSGDVLIAAERLQSVDLLLTVDTMMAHLAGALALPVWTMLPFEADWRWMLERGDTPWYPTMRLFRQPSPGDWNSVLEQVAYSLEVSYPGSQLS